jgi:hypothetical protein
VSVAAVAAALGAWLSPRALVRANRIRQVSVWLAVCAAGSIGLLFGAPLAVLAGFSVLCFGEGGVNSATMAYRQQRIPDELAGRVNTVIRTFITGAVPVSALALGLTVNLVGSGWVFVPVAATACLAFLLWSVRRGGRLSQAAHPLVGVGSDR